MMLRLKAEGWGVKKGIPDLILAGGTASDVTAVTMFGIFTAWILGDAQNNLLTQLGTIPVYIVLGTLLGFLAGKLVHYLLHRTQIAENVTHNLIISLGLGLLLVIGEHYLPYSNFLAVMVMGFVILETDEVLARRLRAEIDRVWVVGEIFLFVLIGAAVNIHIVAESGLAGLAIITIGLVIGRWSGIAASTWGSNITTPESRFMVIGQMAKATVQAAIGGIPLTLGIEHGEYILAIAVLSILYSAPLGAFLTALLAPKMLEKGAIDPTKVTIKSHYRFLVAMDGSPSSLMALEQAAKIARQTDGELIILNVQFENEHPLSPEEIQKELEIASDVKNEILMMAGNPAEIIMETAQHREVDYIYLGRKGHSSTGNIRLGNISRIILEYSDIPVILVEGTPEGGDIS